MDEEDEIPLEIDDDPFTIGEVDENQVDEGTEEELSEEEHDDDDEEDETIDIPIPTMGDLYIILLDSRDEPFLAKIVEINTDDGIVKVEDDLGKILLFLFESNEIVTETVNYRLIN